MFQTAKCLGLSLTLHAVAVALILLLASGHPERRPDPVLVVLESSLPTELMPGRSVSPETTPAEVRPATPRVTDPDPVGNAGRAVRPRQALASPAAVQVTQARLVRVPRSLPDAAPEPAASPAGMTAPKPAARPVEPSAGRSSGGDTSSAVTGKESVRGPTGEIGQGASRHAPAPAPLPTNDEPQRYQRENFGYLRDRVMKHLEYPPLARRMRWSGRVVVSFTVMTDGNVDNLRVVEGSGRAVLDQCALQTVRKAAPFRKPVRPAEIVLPVGFELK